MRIFNESTKMDDLIKYAVSFYSTYICRNFTDGLCLTMLSNSMDNTPVKYRLQSGKILLCT